MILRQKKSLLFIKTCTLARKEGIPIEGKHYCLLAFQIQNPNICLNFTPGELEILLTVC